MNVDFDNRDTAITPLTKFDSESSGTLVNIINDKSESSNCNVDVRNIKRRRLLASETEYLSRVFTSDPWPNSELREHLAKQLSMTPRNIQVWFQNRRAKIKRNLSNYCINEILSQSSNLFRTKELITSYSHYDNSTFTTQSHFTNQNFNGDEIKKSNQICKKPMSYNDKSIPTSCNFEVDSPISYELNVYNTPLDAQMASDCFVNSHEMCNNQDPLALSKPLIFTSDDYQWFDLF